MVWAKDGNCLNTIGVCGVLEFAAFIPYHFNLKLTYMPYTVLFLTSPTDFSIQSL